LETKPFELKDYETPDGRCPYQEWYSELVKKDLRSAVALEKRIRRLEQGLLGDYKEIEEGILELRIHLGQGFRLYVRQIGKTMMLLLVGGEKSNQEQDIRNAFKYWYEFKSRNKGVK
jgi:putative addiction module killer protein